MLGDRGKLVTLNGWHIKSAGHSIRSMPLLGSEG
jgi:hypothetical protein